MEESNSRTGVPKEAWAAIGVIGAAAVTGLVTIIVNHTNSDRPSESPTSSAPAIVPGPSPVAAMVGHWNGTANTEGGQSFSIVLDIDHGCRLGELCGAIGVSSVPCYGQVFLNEASDGEAEFRVANFDARSDPARCQEGAGELFRLLPDGTLAYRTTYAPIAEGVLQRF